MRHGAFDPDDTIMFIDEARSSALGDGFNGLCLTSEMTWALGPEPGNDRMIEYASKVNRFLVAHDDVVVLGQYSRRRFDAETIRNVLRTHPIVGFAGEMAPNVYYVPPDEFLGPAWGVQAVERILTNIANRRRMTNGLRAAASYNRSLYDLNLDALVTTTPEGAIRDANAKMESLLGCPRAELLGTDFASHASDPDRVATFLAQVRDEGSVADFEISMNGAGGETTPVSLNAFVLRDNLEKVRAIISSARDLSGEKRVARLREDALESAREFDQARTDFVARVSHELRSPLTAVLGYVELLTDEDAHPLDDEQRSMLGVIERNGRRLLSLVEDLLTMSRVGAGTLELHREPVSAASLVEHALEGFMPQITKRQLTSDVAVDGSLELNVDRDKIERAIVNLVSNAVKFTEPGGHISVACRRDGDDAVIAVRDNGIGIPVDEQSQLFKRFFRSRLSRQRETQGTGIGLFLVNQIVEAHGGRVTVTSLPGTGTTVEVRLPLTDAETPTGDRGADLGVEDVVGPGDVGTPASPTGE